MKNIKKLLDGLSAETNRIIATPEVIEKLKSKGLPIVEKEPLTLEETLDNLFSKREKVALENARKLPDTPINMEPAIQSLYTEIQECIIFSLNGAAITLMGILVEFVLKYVTYIKEVGGHAIYESSKWDEFENIAFDSAIKRAEKVGLLDKKIVRSLRRFKNETRNPYNHYNIKKITKDVTCEKVKILNINTDEIDEKDIKAVDSPMIQAQAKPFVDRENVFRVFSYTNKIVKYLISQIN